MQKPENVDLLTKWFENTPYGITFKFPIKDKFGERSTVIVSAIRRGLEDIKDGEYTDQEMLDEFIRIVKARAFENDNKPLTDDENKAVEEAAQMTVSSFSDKKKRNIAFKLLSKN